jgi:hypothetical protein
MRAAAEAIVARIVFVLIFSILLFYSLSPQVSDLDELMVNALSHAALWRTLYIALYKKNKFVYLHQLTTSRCGARPS